MHRERRTIMAIPGLEDFSKDFAEARKKFEEAVLAAGFGHCQYYPATVTGDQYQTAVVAIGEPTAPYVQVVISGTHGPEGFLGSAIQTGWLRLKPRVRSNVRVVLVHALNAWGMTHGRRVTEENIDLNRNGWRLTSSLPRNAGYEEWRSVLEPTEWSRSIQEETKSRLQQAYDQKDRSFREAITRGQYSHRKGLFFGGRTAAKSRQTFEAILSDLKNGPTPPHHLSILDIHTGLGPHAKMEIICPYPKNSDVFHRAEAWYAQGYQVRSPVEGGSTSINVTGDILRYADNFLVDTPITPVAAEFGTHSFVDGVMALIGENWAYHHPHTDPQTRADATEALLDFFYPPDSYWQRHCLDVGLRLVDRAISALATI